MGGLAYRLVGVCPEVAGGHEDKKPLLYLSIEILAIDY